MALVTVVAGLESRPWELAQRVVLRLGAVGAVGAGVPAAAPSISSET